MKVIDTRGQVCPAPLIATKRSLKEGSSFQVLTGSQNALNNISRFLADNKIDFKVTESGDFWTITVFKIPDPVTRTDGEEYKTDHKV